MFMRGRLFLINIKEINFSKLLKYKIIKMYGLIFKKIFLKDNF